MTFRSNQLQIYKKNGEKRIVFGVISQKKKDFVKVLSIFKENTIFVEFICSCVLKMQASGEKRHKFSLTK